MADNKKDKTEKEENKKNKEISPQSVTEEMEDSYLDYAMSVIVSRALPDVRDGLKPVQRRILYAMYKAGWTSGAQFKKCATIVGRTLGRYHPHGDLAVYDALVRMAQDFSLRYPTIEGQGNFGSIDDDPAAAMRYCITGDSLITTNRCLEKIEDIPDGNSKEVEQEIDLKILSFNQKVNSASKWFDSGKHPTLKVETKKGYHLEGTSNHPILTLQKNKQGKPSFEWKLLEKITTDDFAVIDRNRTMWAKKNPELIPYYPNINKQTTPNHKLPEKMSPELAFVMGGVVSEGYISTNEQGSSHQYKIGFVNTDQEFLQKFKKKFKKVFPDCHISEGVRSPTGYGKKQFTQLEICSLQLVKFFKNLGVKEVKAGKKRVPEILLDCPEETVAAFLRGYFEGDGSIYECARSPVIDTHCKSKKLLEDIQIVLLKYGIVSSIYKDKKRNIHRLFIRGQKNLNRFKENIGFISSIKVEKLKKFARKNKNHKAMSKTDYIPYLSNYLRGKYLKKDICWERKKWLKKHNLDRYPKLEKYHDKLKEILDKKDQKLIEKLLDSNYLFEQIKSVKRAGYKKVYSIKVESKCHSFVSNGFISHNTEARLRPISEAMLQDIDKDTVEWSNNFDNTRQEPDVLPSKVPQLLLNGAVGIAVGMATSIPPHNLGEVVDALLALSKDSDLTTKDLTEYIKGPDFPTGGSIYCKEDILSAYAQGRGPITERAKTKFGQDGHTPQIIVNELTYQTNKARLIEKIAKKVKDDQFEQIKDIRDESDKDGIRVVIELKRGANPDVVLNRLYKKTNLQRKFHLNMVALKDGIQPQVFSLKELLEQFLKHRKKVIRRRTEFELDKAQKRIHILEGYSKALKSIDEVIATIKKSKDKEKAHKNLKDKFGFSDKQTEAILKMRLQALSGLEREKIETELKEKRELAEELQAILDSKEKILEVLRDELKEVKKEYGDERRTAVHPESIEEIKEENLIQKEDVFVTLTREGYIKRLPTSSYKKQGRAGYGIIGQNTKDQDTVSSFFEVQTNQKILFFSNQGRVYQLRAHQIPEASRQARGKPIVSLLPLKEKEKVITPLVVDQEDEAAFVALATKNGKIKKTELEKFESIQKTGIKAIGLKEDDQLCWAKITTGNDEFMLVTREGKSIRFSEKEVRAMGRSAQGVKGIDLAKEDHVISMNVISEDEKGKLLVLTRKGLGKKTDLDEFRSQSRGGKGIIAAKTTKKTGPLSKATIVGSDDKEIIVASTQGKILRTALEELPAQSRNTQGVKVMRLKEKDKVASFTIV